MLDPPVAYKNKNRTAGKKAVNIMKGGQLKGYLEQKPTKEIIEYLRSDESGPQRIREAVVAEALARILEKNLYE